MKKHTILFLAANPSGTDSRALDREARAIQVELERSGFRDSFELVTRWAAEPLDLLRELRRLKPTVVHVSGHGGQGVTGEHQPDQAPRRDVVGEPDQSGSEQQHGLFFQGPDGRAQLVSTAALEETFGAAGASVKLVVLNACYSELQATALLAHVDCVVGIGGAIRDDAARSFAIGFYGGLGERESVAAAYKQGCAAISLEGLPDGDRPQLKIRTGVDATQLVLAADPPSAAPPSPPTRAGLIDFTVERQRHVQFVGRAALLARLDQLLLADRADRWVVVTGGPGMGKSALLAAWLAQREAAGAVVPHHFIRRGEYDWDEPAKLVGSLVAQIEARFPDQREPDADARMHPAARLAATLGRLSESELVPRGERLVVLIDGLDEYDPPAGTLASDPLAAFLPHTLPRGVSLVCASRPRHPYVSSLEARDGGLVRIDLDDPSSAADNDATVRRFWEQAAPPLGLDARFIDAAVTSAGGNVQHAVTLQKHLAGLPAEQRRALAIPRGLAALLERSWERVATDPVVVTGLGILCAAREALTLDELGTVAGWIDNAQRRVFLRGAKELLVETQRPDGHAEYRLHHDSIRSYIAEALGTAALRGHHAALARRLATWPAPLEPTARRYALRHALVHRVEAGEWADAWRLAADMRFLEAKCCELGAHEAEVDVTRAVERCRASGDEALRGRFDDLARALVRESPWLRAAPEATAALVWNRLRRSGWSTDDIDRQLQLPAEATFLRLRHVATCESPALVRDLVGHADWVSGCAVTPDGLRVVSASADRTLKVWDLASGRALATLQGHADWVLACAVTPDSRCVVSASADKTLKVWDLASGRALATLQGHSASVNACAVTPDGRCVVSASADHTLQIWDLASGRALATLQGHTARVSGCAVTPDGLRVVSASADKTLKVWDLASGRTLVTLQGHADWVIGCAVTPDGLRVVSASADDTLKVWDLASGRALATLQGHSANVRACAVTPDGLHVVSASDDHTLKVWDLASGRALATLQGHSFWVLACAMTPDGRRVVSASWDETLKVWDLASGRTLATLQGHSDRVRACAMAPDGRRVVSASADKTLKVWDLESYACLFTHRANAGYTAVAATATAIIAGDATGAVWFLDWPASRGAR